MIGRRTKRPTALSMVTTFMAVLLLVTFVIAYAYPKKIDKPPTRTRIDVQVAADDSLKASFIGDSLTYGLYATDAAFAFHQEMVQEWRRERPVDEYAVNTVGGTVAGTLSANDFPSDQHLYVIELGTNDATRVDYSTFRSQYRELVERIRASSPDAEILCIGVWRPKKVADVFDTVIKDVCESHDGVFRSITDLSINPELKGPAGIPTFAGLSDTFHPNDTGHRMIADRMLDAVTIEGTA